MVVGLVAKCAVLQIRRDNWEKLWIISFLVHKNMTDPSLEPSDQEVLMRGHNMFSLRNKENYLCIIIDTTSYFEH